MPADGVFAGVALLAFKSAYRPVVSIPILLLGVSEVGGLRRVTA